MIKPFIITTTILFLIIVSLAVVNKSLNADLEKSNLSLKNLRTELASSMQSLRICEEKITVQNNSIEAYILDMKKKRKELANKNALLTEKYKNLVNKINTPITCNEMITLIDKQQEQFFE